MAWTKPIGKYPGNWDSIKQVILNRAKFRCEQCEKKDHDTPRPPLFYVDETISRGFRVHHKDRDKSNCDQSNLIYLCRTCHGEAHRKMNREVLCEVV